MGGLQPETVVGGHYRLVRLLGEGGMGWVWEAVDQRAHEPVALKILKGAKDEDRKRFQREVRAAAAIHHPNVIAVHEFLELPDGTLVIVMDLLEGETLGSVLRRDQRISFRDLGAVFLPVLEALEAAHAQGIVHRDLKPDNIFLCGTDSDVHVKVLDFGVAKLTADGGLAARTQALTGTGSMVGTPYYMSPEQVYADKDLDSRADIWSLGVVMYECLTGIRPTEADTMGRVLRKIMDGRFDPVTAHCADVPDDLASLIGRMLSVERTERPSTFGEIREILERHAATGFPSFSRASSLTPIDPHAATIATPHEGVRGPGSSAARPSDGAVARSDTNRGLAVVPTGRARGRTRLVALGALAVVALLGTAASLRNGDTDTRPSAGAVTSAMASSPIAPSTSASASPEPLPRVDLEDAALKAAVSNTQIVRERPPPSGTPSARPAVPALSRPTCEVGEVLSEGHCCQRGHIWRSGRCERPLATSF